MKHKLTLAAMAVLLTIGLSSAAAYADTLTITLNDPIAYVSGAPGSTATYTLTVSAPSSNGADVFLNGDSFNVSSPFTLDDTDFFVNAPILLDPGTSATFDAFTVTAAAGATPGAYLGSFTIEGGANEDADNPLGTVNFTTDVTPEPSSFLLLGSGLAGVFATIRRTRSRQA
jgi:hypothetical protein